MKDPKTENTVFFLIFPYCLGDRFIPKSMFVCNSGKLGDFGLRYIVDHCQKV